MIAPDFPAPTWRKSSYSGNTTNCVEIAHTPTTVGVRDTKHRDGGTLVLTTTAWAGLRDTLTDG